MILPMEKVHDLVFWTCIDGMRRNGEFALPTTPIPFRCYLLGISIGAFFGFSWYRSAPSHPHCYIRLALPSLLGVGLGYYLSLVDELKVPRKNQEVSRLIVDLGQKNTTAESVREILRTNPQGPLEQVRQAYLSHPDRQQLDVLLVHELKGHPWATEEIVRVLGDSTPIALRPFWYRWWVGSAG